MVKRSAITGAVACCLALVVVVAPALSLGTYRPEPVDFSMAAPPGAVLGDPARSGEGVVSKPLHAPKRFNLMGLSWEGAAREPAIAVRSRTDGGEWTRWVPLATEPADGPDPRTEGRSGTGVSSPTWVGEADWVQYRASEALPGLRLRFVNVRGTATAADRARTALRRTVNAGLVSLAGAARAAVAHAGGPQPAIVPRSGWGAEDCPPRTAPDYGEVRAAFVHHTVTANDYTREEAPDAVLAICRFHRNSNGWNDIGYNFLVDRFGTIYEGRAGGIDRPVIGAQAQGYNAQSTGIANLGTYSSVGQTPEALNAMAALIRWKLPIEGAPTAGTTTMISAGGSSNRYPAGQEVTVERVIGHRDTGSTACPGSALYAQLPELRSLVGNFGPSGTATRLRARVTARRGTVLFGRPAGVTGRLTVGGGAPLTPLPVQIEALVGARWRPLGAATADENGDFATSVAVKRTRALRARFSGSPELRPGNSPRFYVRVKPVVTLSRLPVRSRAGAATKFRGRVAPRKRYVWQVLQVRRDGRYRTVGAKRLRVKRDGTFAGRFVPARAASFRFYVVSKPDRFTVRGASRAYRLGVSRTRGGGAVAP